MNVSRALDYPAANPLAMHPPTRDNGDQHDRGDDR